MSYQESEKTYLSNVQVLNDTISTNDHFLADTLICMIIVKIKLKKLFSIMEIDLESNEFSVFINNLNRPFIYQETMTSEMKKAVRELSEHSEISKFEKLYYRIRIMELMYQFFVRFSRRTISDFVNINRNDIEKILSLESLILDDLKTPPKLPELARSIGMCESKMKQLFKRYIGLNPKEYAMRK